ncbi:hypothetical protein RHSIM_Rhsim07G0089500 [Rhododendron simsii]|uniref:HAT C-terminal dimerisation domain-containing protein n=1 Tax=Rhododendron simsii TaxID=118357 RepID=A0A834GMV2_RHOSS|nr:hypothetical protein RHSIM_Rhsim07G0089500 [Rhododendron simsii]
MDPENIHFDNEGLNPDSGDDGPTQPPGREFVGEVASNIATGSTPIGVTGRSQLAQSCETRRHSWVWRHSTIVKNFKNAQGIDIGARAACNYCPKNHTDVISAYVNSKYMRTNGGLTRADWKIAFEFMNFLKKFYAATLACSGVRYPTTCIVLNHLYNMSHTLKIHRTKPNFVAACKSVEDKFNQYFQNMPTIFIVDSVMDPRIKVKGVEKLLKGIGESLGITLTSASTITALLTSICASYESKFACTITTAATPYSSTINDPCSTSNNDNDPSWFLISGPVTDEELRSFDILAWWKKIEKTFVILSIMARDLLTPHVSLLASKSAFSACNRVLDESMSRLAPDILDCLICLKDWKDARLGIQKCHPRDEFRDCFLDLDIDAD